MDQNDDFKNFEVKNIKLKGFLEKESPNLLGSYKSRFVQLIDSENGFIMTYADNEGGELKGIIPISDISEVLSSSKKEFKFRLGDRKFKFKASSQEVKEIWIKTLNEVRILISNIKRTSTSINNNENQLKNTKTWKMNNQDKNIVLDLMDKGICTNKESEFSLKLLDIKGIKALLKAIPLQKQKLRIKYGFLLKKNKHNNIQKRWFFLVSSRPLTVKGQVEDEDTLSQSCLPSNISFDTLYYYTADDENDTSSYKGELDLKNCSKIETKESEKDFYIIIDMNDRKFELLSNVCWERDSWYESLITSRNTVREISSSITGKPRNVVSLVEIYEKEGESRIKKIIEKEIDGIKKDLKEIKDIQILNLIINKLDNHEKQTIDGLGLQTPKNIELIKLYAQKINLDILNEIQKYWKNVIENIGTTHLLDLTQLFFNQNDKLNDFGIHDQNFYINGLEVIKLFTRKTIKNIENIIDNILKNEREHKALKSNEDEGDLLITNGPYDLFRLLSQTFDIIKKYKIKEVYEMSMDMLKECILLYLIGVYIVITRTNLIIENEFLIAICNNSIKLSSLLNDFIDDINKNSIDIKEIRVEESIGKKDILKSINQISEISISRLVYEIIENPNSTIKQISFTDEEFSVIIDKYSENFKDYNKYMHFSTQKKYWNEIIKLMVIKYFTSIIKLPSKSKIDDVKTKINNDKALIITTFSNIIGKNQIEESTKLLSLVVDFLSSDLNMISFPLSNIKNQLEDSLKLPILKSLISLRSDWDKKQKEEAIETCEDFLNTWNRKHTTNTKMKKKDEFLWKISDDLLKQQNDDMANHMKDDDLADIQTVQKNENFNIDDFLSDEEEPLVQQNTMKNVLKKLQTINNSNVSDIIKEGIMHKSSNKKKQWQERYFQLKKGGLYWYSSQSSMEASNFISLSQIKTPPYSHKERKFTIITEVDGTKTSYFFKCPSQDDCQKWIEAIKYEMYKGNQTKKIDENIDLPLVKLIITFDNMSLLKIFEYKKIFKEKILNKLNEESFFKPKVTNKHVEKENNIDIISKKTFEILDKKKHSVDLDKASFVKDMNIDNMMNEDESKRSGCCGGGIINIFKSFFI